METLTIVLKADGSGLTGTLSTSTGEFRKFGAEVDKAGKQAGGAGDKFSRAGRQAKTSGDDAEAGARKWEQSGKAIGAAIGAAVVTLTALMARQIGVADSTGKMAERLGVGARFVSEYGYAAKTAGLESAGFETGLDHLRIAAAKAADGVRGPSGAFRALGVDVRTASGQVKTLEQLLPEIANRFARLEEGPRKAAVAAALFGEEVGSKWTPLLSKGAAGIDELRAKAVELGLSLGDDTAAQAAKFKDNMADLRDITLGFVNNLMADALPALNRFSGNLVEDSKAASDAAGGYGLLTIAINSVATAYYFVRAVVERATYYLAASVNVVMANVAALGNAFDIIVAGIAGAKKAVMDGDVSGWVENFRGTVAALQKNSDDFVNKARDSFAQASEMAEESFARNGARAVQQWKGGLDDATASAKANGTATEQLGTIYDRTSSSARLQAQAAREMAQSIAALNQIIRDQANEYVGPVQAAWNDYQAVLAKVAKEEADIARAAGLMRSAHVAEVEIAKQRAEGERLVTQAREQAAKAYEHNLKLAEREQQELDRRSDVVGFLVKDYTDESRAISQTNREREIQQVLIKGEEQARKNYQRGLRDSIALTQAEADAIRAGIDAAYTQREFMELARDAAEEYRSSWWNAIGSVSTAFGDFATSGIKSLSDFADVGKNIVLRWISDVIAAFTRANLGRLFLGWMNQGEAGGGGSWMSQLAGLVSGGNNLTGSPQMAGGGWLGAAAGAGSLMGFGNNVAGLSTVAGAGAGGGGGMGGLVQIGGTLYQAVGGSGITGGMIAGASYAAGALGAVYGWKQGGDTAGKVAGAAAYGAAGFYGATAVGTVAAGYATAGVAGAAAAGTAALAAIPVAGWIALAAIAVDKISGGKLFGTDYKAKEITQTIALDAAGATASASVYEEGQKSLFRGKKRRTRDVDAGDDARAAAEELYAAIDGVARSAADALGLASVDIIAGSFQQVTDAKGNLKRQFSTILGRVYDESIEEFQQRLGAENIIAQVSQLDDTASAIAERWRSSAADLQDGAQFLLAAAVDFNAGAGLLTEGGLGRLADLIEHLARADETLTQAYQRVMSGAMAYGNTAAAAYQDVATAGFSNFAKSLLQIRQEEKERTRALQDQARALGGLSAREEDLAKVREAAQLKTDALVRSLESELVDLALNRINDQIEQLGGAADGASSKIGDFLNSLRLSEDLSPDTDARKRVTANDLMNTAALAGDVEAFTQYAQQFLEISRRLNASGAGYQADFDRVQQLAGGFGADGSSASLDELYAQRAALQAQQEAAARLERAQRIAQGVSDLAGVKGGDPLEILRNVTGLTPEALAGDLGLSVSELSDYLAAQQTDIGDLADILYELPRRIAIEMVSVLADRELPTAPASATGTGASSGRSTSSVATQGTVSDPDTLAALHRIAGLLEKGNTDRQFEEMLRQR